MGRRSLIVWGLGLPPGLWLVLFFLAPLALVFLFSFGEREGITGIALTWTLDNYLKALEPLYLAIVLKSLVIAGLATVICLLLGYPIAFAIAFSPKRLRLLLLVLVALPFWINVLVRTYALIALLRTRGTVNFTLEWLWEGADGFLRFLGVGGWQILGERFEPWVLLYNNTAVVMGVVYAFLPFMVLPLYASLEKMDRSLMEASLDLGAGHWRTFIRVVFPLTWHGALSGLIIVFIPSLGAFYIPDLLGGTDSQLIGNVIERQFKSANHWPFGAALSFLLMYATFAAIVLKTLLGGRDTGQGV